MAEMATKQGEFISMGSGGPLCHVIVPAGKNSLLLAVSLSLPPRMNTPMSFIVTAAMSDLARQPIAVSDISVYICLIDIRGKSKEQMNERRAGLPSADKLVC